MHLVNLPLHAAIEMGGAIFAGMAAYLLIRLNASHRGSSFNYSLSSALLAMGFLDAFHAITPPGNCFVWLHSAASVLGGVFFATVWLPESFFKSSIKYLPIFAILSAVSIGLYTIALPSHIPLMFSQGNFTPFSITLHITSGLLMLLAAAKLYIFQKISRKVEDQFFLIQTLLFGISCLLFTASSIWEPLWWGWHFMRLIAYASVLWLVVKNEREMEEEIHKLAFYDALTGLANRRLLADRLEIATLSSIRNMQFGAILFIDIDKFKTINDTLGHMLGDMLLKEVANRLKNCLREADTVARIGGDEFAIFVESLGENEADASNKIAHLAEKILAALAEEYHLTDQNYLSSASIGINLFRGSNTSADELINRADMAMYEAKNLGRNRVRFFDMLLQTSVEQHAAIESEIRHAITDHQLALYYQIQIDHEMNPIGAEALLRWRHPERGFISPDQFIPIAEESTLINDLGDWVLNAACKQLSIWKEQKETCHLVLAVNISAMQFKEPDFVEIVKGFLTKYALNASCLKLEVTEGVVLNDLELIITKMNQLKAMGISLSLDDFGTGYSSLSYLKQLPFDQIKIDQKFVIDIANHTSDAVMVKTIIELARNFKMSVIAEGVETDLQLAYLKQYGCKLYQGYYFGKPLPVESFEALLNKVKTQQYIES